MASGGESQRGTCFPQRSVWPGGVASTSTAAAAEAVVPPNALPVDESELERLTRSCAALKKRIYEEIPGLSVSDLFPIF